MIPKYCYENNLQLQVNDLFKDFMMKKDFSNSIRNLTLEWVLVSLETTQFTRKCPTLQPPFKPKQRLSLHVQNNLFRKG